MSTIDIADKTTLDAINRHTKPCRTVGQFRSLTDYDLTDGIVILDLNSDWILNASVKLYLRLMRPVDGGDVDDIILKFKVDGEEWTHTINNASHGDANDVFLYEIYDPGASLSCSSLRMMSEEEFTTTFINRGRMGFNGSANNIKVGLYTNIPTRFNKHWDIMYKYVIDYYLL